MHTANSFTHELDERAINTIRTLAADVVQKANSGHPGAPMGCAPMAHVLFSRFLRASPATNPSWINRDRFVLSNGHACALLYVMLHLLGSPSISMDQLKSFRQLGSMTPGHPESHITPGVEVATGPLGQGISSAVGLALAQAHLAATFNVPDSPYENLLDNFTYVILGDGCLQEGVSAEASSLAGHLRLGRLIALYDDNHITIDGNTSLSFTEDVCKRYEAYGWHTITLTDGDSTSASALDALADAIEQARKVTDKPSLIRIRTTIGFGSAKAGTDKVHGAPLGAADIAHAKRALGCDPELSFHVADDVKAAYAALAKRNASSEEAWHELFKGYEANYPTMAAEFKRREALTLPEKLIELLPTYAAETTAPMATRKLSEILLNAIAHGMPELVGGSADLTASNLTRWNGAVDMQHPDTGLGNYAGRYIRYGVREHGMAAISNGLASYGLMLPFCSTFLNFISYGLGAVRISALSKLQVIYIMTHDSIGLGEDGPTHQPIETLAGLRAMPNLLVLRPADGNEVSGAYLAALTNRKRPSVIALSRQNVPMLKHSSVENVLKGAYTVHVGKSSGQNANDAAAASRPDVVIVATGTEVALAIEAAEKLGAATTGALRVNVVSMPCCELFDEMSYEYRVSVFPPNVLVVSVEALATYGWERYAHAHIGMSTFGASAPIADLYRKFNITVDAIIAKIEAMRLVYASTVPANKMLRV